LKHGVIALIDAETPSVCICPDDSLYEKNISTIQEIKARRGPVIAVATEGDREIAHHADDVIFVPRTIEMLQPILNVLPLQLLAYHAAVALGRDVDKPRNLAKSVTVE
jgi:glucosamine--fructose-6-phosphate aminotransferase (isomerizing)